MGSPELPKVIKNLFKKVLGSARDAIDSRTLFWEALEVVQGLIFDRIWREVEVVFRAFLYISSFNFSALSLFSSIIFSRVLYDFSFLAPCPSNGLIIQGTEDKIVEEECVTELVEKLNKQKNLKIQNYAERVERHF